MGPRALFRILVLLLVGTAAESTVPRFLEKSSQFGLQEISQTIREKHDGDASRFLLDVLERLEQGDDLSRASGHLEKDEVILQADTIRSLPVIDVAQEKQKRIQLSFNLSSVNRGEEAKRAELRLSRAQFGRNLKVHGQYQARVCVFIGSEQVKCFRTTVQPQREASHSHLIFDLTAIMTRIIDAAYDNATIKISLKRKQRRTRRNARGYKDLRTAGSSVGPIKVEHSAILVLFTKTADFLSDSLRSSLRDPSHSSVHTRNTHRINAYRRQRRNANRQECQKKDLIIDFDEIGWGQWIVYPKKFNAFQCSGRCPSPVDQFYDPTNHAVLQSLVRLTDKKVPRPCCVPIKLSPLSMLYYVKDEIVIRHHEGMVVDKCGCR